MIDFNNPNLTTQMKQDLLSLENPEVLMKRIKDSKIAVEKGLGNYSSRSYWIIKPSQLFDLNRWTMQTDLKFMFNDFQILGTHPDCDVILLEHDRVEKGEYDNFLLRKSPYGYTQVNVVIVNGTIDGDIPSGVVDDEILQHTPLDISEEELKSYDCTYRNRDHILYGAGVFDCSNDQLDDLEDQRTNKRTWLFSGLYEESMNNYFSTIYQTRKPKKIRKNTKGFG